MAPNASMPYGAVNIEDANGMETPKGRAPRDGSATRSVRARHRKLPTDAAAAAHAGFAPLASCALLSRTPSLAPPLSPAASRFGRVALVAAAVLVVAMIGYATVPANTLALSATEVADVEEVAACICVNGYTGHDTDFCASCYPGYYLTGTNCAAWGGVCSGGFLLAQDQRTDHNQCAGCNAGYYQSGTSCFAYGGTCANGYLRPQDQRTGHDQCNSCYGGYYLSGTTCVAYGGSCANGWLKVQSARTQQNHCGECAAGYYLSGATCYGYGGSCSNGALRAQELRTSHDQCGACDGGYYLSGSTCVGYGGSCANGALITQSQRTKDNECGVCLDGYTLSDGFCNGYEGACNNGEMKPSNERNGPGDCASCDAGFFLSAPDATASELASGAEADGWSSGEITNVGSAGNMHGPWGDDVKSVSKTFTIAAGVSSCTVSWDSYTFNSRDSETDRVYLNGVEVWSASPQWSTGAAGEPEGAVNADADVSTYLASYCWNGCSGYTYKYSNSVTVDCSGGTLAVLFTSDLDQSEGDEGWGFNNFVLSDAAMATVSDGDGDGAGASADGWSNGEITNVGNAGNMHGPWGDDVKSVSKTFTLPPSATYCTLSWDSYAFNSRDSETDYVYLDGVQVWTASPQWSTGAAGEPEGAVNADADVSTYLASYCWNGCSGYTYKYSNTATVDCAGELSVEFRSGLDQGESDEGWGFNNVRLSTASGRPASCLDLKNAGSVSSGTYTIYPSGSAVSVYCDMTTDGGGYDMLKVYGTRTYGKYYSNSCPAGMDIFVPRTQAHFSAAVTWANDNRYLYTVGVSRPDNGCGTCTSTAMNSVTAPSWEAVDGGSWWFRDSTYNEPNGDYTANCWLNFYNLPSDAGNMHWNDGNCNYSTEYYVCSTNAKDPALGEQKTGPVSTCVGYAGVCTNGQLRAVASRTDDNQCGSCDDGYYLSGTSCYPYGGNCVNGELIGQASRSQDNQCGRCDDGFYNSGVACVAYGGSCANGQLIAQSQRMAENHCGSCNAGYYMTGGHGRRLHDDAGEAPACAAYGGECANGVMIASTLRTMENHCGSCDAGYFLLADGTCAAYEGVCDNGVLKEQADRVRENDCKWCDDGYYMSDGACAPYGEDCADGVVKPQDERLMMNHCNSCETGKVLSGMDRAEDYAVSMGGYEGSPVVMTEGMRGWTDSEALLQQMPGELEGAVLMQGASQTASATTITFTPTYDSDVYVIADDAAFFEHGEGWTNLGTMVYATPVEGVTDAYICNPGTSNSADWVVSQTADNSEAACAAQCDFDAGCTGFDWKEEAADDACRLFGALAVGMIDETDGGVKVDTDSGRTWCMMCTPCADGAGNEECAGPTTPGTCSSPELTTLYVHRYTQQAQCGTRDPECSKTLTITAMTTATVAYAADTTGFNCGGCQSGYYGADCVAYGGSCANGQMIDQSERTMENHCGSCNSGYFLENGVCRAWEGSCANGALAEQSLRLTHDYCGVCNPGYTLSDGAAPWCQACAPGTYTDDVGTGDCQNCIAGKYQDQYAQTGCEVCADGYFAAEEGTANCITCGDGYEPNGCLIGEGAGVNEAAAGGAAAAGWSNGEITSVGTAGNMHGPWGNDVTSVSKTFPVPAGITECTVSWDSYGFNSRDSETDRVYIDGVEVWSKVFQWNQGGYDSSGVQTYLSEYCWGDCQAYTYKESASVTVACGGSMHVQFTSGIDQNEPDEGWGFNNFEINSADGWDCVGSKTQCDICSTGMWSHDGDAKCSDCAPGYYAPATGYRDCAACEPGKKQPSAGSDACVDCAAGKYQGWYASTVCYDCNVGRVAPTEGMASCDYCVPGKVMPSIGQTECNDCQIGEFQPNSGQTLCPQCVPGQVTPTEGMPTCDLCEAGKQQPLMGQGTCDDCAMGYVAPVEGMPLCDACQMGEFMDEEGQLFCKSCNQPEGSYPENAKTTTTYEGPTFPAATAKGFYTGWQAATLCEPWTECQNCEHIDFEGSATRDRTCVPCEPETWNDNVDEPQCTEWTVCPGSADADYDGADQGLVTLGTCNSDSVCADCGVGEVTINDDFYSQCYDLLDVDGDTKFDRFIYNDFRQVGERAARLGRTPFVAETDFDKKRAGPDTGGVYDRCPFDPNDDEDGDDICAEWTPDKLAHFVDQQAGVFYAPGGSRQDFCPLDSDNDLDQDGKCDDVDRQVVTWNFLSNNLVGWKDAECEQEPYHLGAAEDACGEPESFKVAAPEMAMPALGADVFGADYRLAELLAINKGTEGADDDSAFVVAQFNLEERNTCDGICQDHGMVCTRAAGGAQKPSATDWYLFEGPYDGTGELTVTEEQCGATKLPTMWDGTYEACGCSTADCLSQDACEDMCGAMESCALYKYTTEGNGGVRCWFMAEATVDTESVCDPSDNNWCIYTDVSGGACPEGQFLNERSNCVDALEGFDVEAGCAGVAESCDDEWVAQNCPLSCGTAKSINIDEATGDCAAIAPKLVCKCEPDPEPIKVEHWSQDELCPTCHAGTMHDEGATGTMVREFKIKKNTLFFGLKAAKASPQYVKLTVRDDKATSDAKAFKNMPSITEVPSATDGDWYPVSWDLSEYIGKSAKLEVVDMATDNGIAVDEFTFFSERTGCLPACMTIRDDICAGETCFYFENDDRAYVNVKQINELEATYCRQVPLRDGGSPLGPGLTTLNGNGPMRTDYLMAGSIPRCFNVDIRGSHLAITIGEQQLGMEDVQTTFMYEPTPALGEDAHCVYPTLKPRCVAFTKPSASFRVNKGTTCRYDQYVDTCFDQCYKIHCPDNGREEACGKSNAFQDCATCCDNNGNVASGCFRRRRRRLGGADGRSEQQEDMHYTENECAANCLNRQGCIGFMNQDGLCVLTVACNNAPKDQMNDEQAEHADWQKGTWKIWDALGAEDLTSGDEGTDDAVPTPRKRKRRKRKPADTTATQPEPSVDPVGGDGGVVAEPELLVGGDSDDQGCLSSAGYEWCESSQKCFRFWEEPCMVCTAEGDSVFALSTEIEQIYTPCCEGLATQGGGGEICHGPEYEPPAPECRMPAAGSEGRDCFSVTPYLLENGLSEDQCSLYFDSYQGGRGCRIGPDGVCDGFKDEMFTPCEGFEDLVARCGDDEQVDDFGSCCAASFLGMTPEALFVCCDAEVQMEDNGACPDGVPSVDVSANGDELRRRAAPSAHQL